MLMFDNEAPKRRQDLRPCEVDGDKAFFHGWITEDRVFIKQHNRRFEPTHRVFMPGNVITADDLQTVQTVYALIEYADGEVAKVDPESVRFVD